MSLRHLTAVLGAAIAVAAIPATASATIMDESWADAKAERVATRYHPSYDFVATCEQQNPGLFWCDVTGRNGSCFLQGHATVKGKRRNGYIYWDVWLRAMNRDCY
jgi:hypothetical protein